jgi:hypothetical protein
VIDRLTGAGVNSYAQYWHLNPEAEGKVSQEGEVVTTPDLILASSLPAKSFALEKGAVSYAYREKTDAPVVKYSFAADGEATVVTVLQPRKDLTELTRLRKLANEGPGIYRLERKGGTDILALNQRSAAMHEAGIETDAEVVFLGLSMNHAVERFFALNGSYLRYNGSLVFESVNRKLDISAAGTLVTATGTNVRKLTVGLSAVRDLNLNGELTKTSLRDGLMIFD